MYLDGEGTVQSKPLGVCLAARRAWLTSCICIGREAVMDWAQLARSLGSAPVDGLFGSS